MPRGAYRHYRQLDKGVLNVGNVGYPPGAFGMKNLEKIFRNCYRHHRQFRHLDQIEVFIRSCRMRIF